MLCQPYQYNRYARNINGRTVWTKGNTNKGTADIDSIINGKPVKIEVKNR